MVKGNRKKLKRIRKTTKTGAKCKDNEKEKGENRVGPYVKK